MTMGYTGQTKATKDAIVYTADGQELGRVKEIVGDCFKVDASMQPDYWLGMDCIKSDDGGVLRLSFRKDELGEAKEDAPEHSPEHSGYHRH